LPKSQYGQAIAYVLNHWEELLRYTEDGRLEIDNNTVERTLRLCAISRNYAQFAIMLTDTSKSRNCCGSAGVAARLGLHNPACPWAVHFEDRGRSGPAS
jgi:transposase